MHIDKHTNIGCIILQGCDWLCPCPHNLLPRVLVAQSCPMDFAIPWTVCSPPVSSGLGILQARTLEWVAIPSSRGYSWSRDQTWVSHITDRFFTHLRHLGSPLGSPLKTPSWLSEWVSQSSTVQELILWNAGPSLLVQSHCLSETITQ